jgi:hypothetical protein
MHLVEVMTRSNPSRDSRGMLLALLANIRQV